MKKNIKVLVIIPARAGSKRIPNKNIRNFLAAIFRESVDLDLVQLWDVEGGGRLDKRRDKLWPIVDLMAPKLGLIK